MLKRTFIISLLVCCYLATAQAEVGIASVYSSAFEGSATASGELYHKNKYTAAHKTLDFGTMVRVTRLDNKRSVVVRINDRGPYIKGHIIDLSNKSAADLNLKDADKANVKLEVIKKPAAPSNTKDDLIPSNYEVISKKVDDTAESSFDKKKEDTSLEKAIEIVKEKAKNTSSTTNKDSSNNDTISKNTKQGRSNNNLVSEDRKGNNKKADDLTEKGGKTTEKINSKLIVRKNIPRYGLYKPYLKEADKLGFGVQVGSFGELENVLRHLVMLNENWFDDVHLALDVASKNGEVYKILVGNFEDQATAEAYAKKVRKKGLKAYTVDYKTFNEKKVYHFRALRPEKKGQAIQVGLFSDKETILEKIITIQKKGYDNTLISVEKGEKGETIYRFLLGPFPDTTIANSYKTHLKKKGIKGFVIDLNTLKHD